MIDRVHGERDDGVEMAVLTPPRPSSSTSSSHPLASYLVSISATGELPTLSPDVATLDSNEALDSLLTPFLPLLTRLQSARRVSFTSHTMPKSTTLDTTLLRVEKAVKWRQYAQLFMDLTPSELQSAVTSDSEPAFRRFESGTAAKRVMIVLCEWLLAAPGSLESSELFLNEIYQEEVAMILVQTLASPKLQTLQKSIASPLSIQSVARKVLAVPLGPVLLSRLAVNDPSRVEKLLDAVVAVVVETTTEKKNMIKQEQNALHTITPVLENARQACVEIAKLTPLYAARLRDKLSRQTTSLYCAAITFELLTRCTSREDMTVFMYQWLKRHGAPGSALRTYVQLASREAAVKASEFQHSAVVKLTTIRGVLLDTLDSSKLSVSPYELTAALGVCVELQVLDSFALQESEQIRILQSLDKLATSSTSSRAVSLAFIVVVLLWYPLAPALSKAPSQRDEHTKNAVTLSQQVLVSLFHSQKADTGPLFVVSAVLFYTKVPALVPFLTSVIRIGEDTCTTTSTSAENGIQVQQSLRVEYLHVFGDVVLKPVLTENLLAREVLTFPPVVRVSALDAVSSGRANEFTLRGLHGLLCEKSFLRHHHARRLENWLAIQIGEQAALPVHPLLVSLLLEWVENYVMAFEYPIAQAPRPLELSIIPLRSTTLTKWLASPLLTRAFECSSGQEHELVWSRGVLGLTYALQFNQRLRYATMVAGSKLSSLVSTSSVASGSFTPAALGPGADLCLTYDLSAFPLRNIATQVFAYGDKGGVFEYVAPTLLKLMLEEHPQLFGIITASVPPYSPLQVLPLAIAPHDSAERDLKNSWFRRRRRCGEVLGVGIFQSPVSWTAAHALMIELQSAPIDVVIHELLVLVNGFLPYAVVSSQASRALCQKVAAFCSQLAALYETRARPEQGASTYLMMRLVHSLCFPDALWRHQQVHTDEGKTFQLLTYKQILEEPFRLVEDAHDGVFRQPVLLRILLGLVRDVRAAANAYVVKCDPSLVPVEGMTGTTLTTSSVQQHQLLQDCLLVHCVLKRLLALSSESSDDEVAEESHALLCTIVNELLAADGKVSSPPRLLLAIHTQGYDATLVSTLVANVPAMKLLWDYWMTPTSSVSTSSSRSTTKPLIEFVAYEAEKDLAKWRFRLRVVLSLCAAHLSGSRQSAAMQQVLRVVWNKLRNGFGNSGENCAGHVNLLGEVLPWIVNACAQNADLSAELVHFLLKLQRQQQSGSNSNKGRDGGRRAAAEAAGNPQEHWQLLTQVLSDTYASFLQQI